MVNTFLELCQEIGQNLIRMWSGRGTLAFVRNAPKAANIALLSVIVKFSVGTTYSRSICASVPPMIICCVLAGTSHALNKA